MITRILIALLICILTGVGLFFLTRTPAVQAPVSEGILESLPPESGVVASSTEEAFRFELADTAAKRIQGLSGRTNVPAGYGLLFVFPEPGMYGFWMKDMRVSIDILWLSDDGTVLAVDSGVSPESYPTQFYPPRDVSLVLETRAGEARARGWVIGAKVPLPDFQQ